MRAGWAGCVWLRTKSLNVRQVANDAFIAHVSPGGQTERIAGMLRQLGVRYASLMRSQWRIKATHVRDV